MGTVPVEIEASDAAALGAAARARAQTVAQLVHELLVRWRRSQRRGQRVIRGPLRPLEALAAPPTQRPLTVRQLAVLEAIEGFVAEYGLPPTLRELAERLGLRATNGVVEHLRRLQRAGYLRIIEGSARGILPLPRSPLAPATFILRLGRAHRDVQGTDWVGMVHLEPQSPRAQQLVRQAKLGGLLEEVWDAARGRPDVLEDPRRLALEVEQALSRRFPAERFSVEPEG